MPESVKISVSEMTHWCKSILRQWVEDDYVVNTWTEIQINRDIIGDFPRGTARLESIIDRINSGIVTKQLEVTTEHITPISARVFSTYRNWPDEVARKGASLASSLADTYGIGIVAVPKPNIIGEGLKPILSANQIGLIITQNNPLLNIGITDLNVIGNNPLAICAPGTPPFLFDGSLSTHDIRHSAVGLKEYADQYGILPPGIVQDANGEASQDLNILYKILEGDRSCGSFPPLGGTKGLWLAMGMEFIAGALTGGFFGNAPGKPWGEGAIIFAFDSKLFNSAHMIKQIQDYLKQFKTYPGYHSFEISNQVMSRGWIEYPKSQLDSIIRVSNRSGINMNFESLR